MGCADPPDPRRVITTQPIHGQRNNHSQRPKTDEPAHRRWRETYEDLRHSLLRARALFRRIVKRLRPDRGSRRREGALVLGTRVFSAFLIASVGFYHTDQPTDVMHASDRTCDKPITARERYHAAIAYSRPVGHRHPDDDTSTATILGLLRITVY